MVKFKENKKLNLSRINEEVLEFWKQNNIFAKSVNNKSKSKVFNFYEGPPSANGAPGIHHVIARTIKDLFCRYKSLKGYRVTRKAGWDTHGLPVEISVEKKLGITKEDIGSTISIEDYNKACRSNVMTYKEQWEKITEVMGYWVDMKTPYVTYDNKYIESVWWILSQFYKKGLLYKGHTIQPYSPKAGTGLSTHELNQPGCYKKIKDTSAIAQFKIKNNQKSDFIFEKNLFFLAWTTTPWTLPSNTALAVGKNITYIKVRTFNQYTGNPITVILAKELLKKFFVEKNKHKKFADYKKGDKELPFKPLEEYKGSELEGIRYEQLLPYVKPNEGDAFRVILADFVSTEDGTGIVHIAPSFGSDDSLVAKQNGIGSLTLVDKEGRFVEEVRDFSGQYVKSEYYEDSEKKEALSVDIQIVKKLKSENKLFSSQKYEHSYPYCWRTDKPILYYPIDSWFVKTTNYKKRMLELNDTINWKPKSTGEGRFGNWLENLVDWNLSRSRFWGIPLPIWRTENGEEERCISSIQELKDEIQNSIKAGLMKTNPFSNFNSNDFSKKNYSSFDLHKPYIDNIILVSKKGLPMKRELDLIDVWFDSGAMPYAQLHYPFENKSLFDTSFPADFIAEGVDQTRGWFFTLHAISAILFDSIAYKNVISNGLVLDASGSKMSKKLGNTINPFEIIKTFGADSTRWYMIVSGQPWENLKFDSKGIQEVERKFFGTLYNTYSFFALYANIDAFCYKESEVQNKDKSELDQWIISELNTLIFQVEDSYEKYEPAKVTRLVQDFVINKLSNWYVRLSRRQFWKGEYNIVKYSAYQTLYTCLEKVALISCPVASFFMEFLFRNLNSITKKMEVASIHLAEFPKYEKTKINIELEEKMQIAQKITSMVLSLRKKEGVRVRQPLQKILIPVLTQNMKSHINSMQSLILSEINVKEIEYIDSDSSFFVKKIKPNFKKLGPKYGGKMKEIADVIGKFRANDIISLEKSGEYRMRNGLTLCLEDVEISSADIPGWTVNSVNGITVALDLTLTDSLKQEGLARELINRIQNLRKLYSYNVTDKINIEVEKNTILTDVINNNLAYICNEALAEKITFVDTLESKGDLVNLIDSISVKINLMKL